MSFVSFYVWSNAHLRSISASHHHHRQVHFSCWSELDNQKVGYIFPVFFYDIKLASKYVPLSFLQNVRETLKEHPQLFHFPVTMGLVLWPSPSTVVLIHGDREGKRIMHALLTPVWAVCPSSQFPSVQSKSLPILFFALLICIPFFFFNQSSGFFPEWVKELESNCVSLVLPLCSVDELA